jgi:hypothetical protein
MIAVRNRLALRLLLPLALALAIAGALYGWSSERGKPTAAPAARSASARLSGPLPPPFSGDIEDAAPLRQVLPLVHLDSMPLGDAIEFLRELSARTSS